MPDAYETIQPSSPWFFYLVRCRDNSLYAGVTTDLDRRLKEHNIGTGARYTCGRRPVVLIYNEKFDNASRAKTREAQVKGWPKVKKERLVGGS
jgi:putative endonuclease